MINVLRKRPFQVGLALFAALNFGQAGLMAKDAYSAYYGNDPVGRNLVSILSQAPLETIMTRTNELQADIHINPANVLDHPSAKFRLDLGNLDTGIAQRNVILRSDKWLDTANYPVATYTLTRVISGSRRTVYKAVPGQKGEMDVEGVLDFHGVKKTVVAHVSAEMIGDTTESQTRLKGDVAHIRASFPLKLDDFGVDLSRASQLKVSNVQQVTVDAFVSSGTDKPAWATN